MKSILFNLIKALLVLILPFVVLIRGAVFFHERYELYAWFSLLGGVVFSALVLTIYFVFIHGYFTGRVGNFKRLKRKYWLALILVLVYCLPGVLFLSAANAKHKQVQNEFTSLHPILRLGISTVIFIDNDLLVTDANRRPEDYRKMGLKKKNHSLHYAQSDGFAHAVDIRVNGRSNVRNWLLKTYFQAMGFNTLRHVGTADHLHVSLMSHDRPGGI
ncbi:MAG: hypothetical protein AAFZ15_00975 [Bacteroidota bacterium]